MHLPGFFTGQAPVETHRALEGPVPWVKCIRGGGDGGDVPMADWEGMSAETRTNWDRQLFYYKIIP